MSEFSANVFPIQASVPLSFESRAQEGPKVDFAELVLNALEEVNQAKDAAWDAAYDVYVYGKDDDLYKATILDEIHDQKKGQMQGVIRTNQNLFQTLMNMQM